jgi:two-component system sensor histidine kinase QseC
MNRSLRLRLLVGMLVGTAALLLAAGATIYAVQRQQLYRAFDASLLSTAHAVALLIHPGPFGYWFDTDGLARLPAGQIRVGALFQLWSDQPIYAPPPRDPDGNQPGGRPWGPRYPGLEPPPDFDPSDDEREPPPRPPPFGGRRGEPEPPEDRASGMLTIRSPLLNGADLPRLEVTPETPRFETIRLPDGVPGRAVGIQFHAPEGPPRPRRTPATLVAVVAASTLDIERQLGFLATLLAATAVGTLAVSGGVAWLVVSRGLLPLAAVAREISAMNETGLKERITARGVPREIEPVVTQLNELLRRLDEAFEHERALTADVAHELRTPVAEIRAIAEITLSRMRGPDEYRQAFGETLEAARTLQGLIEKLLMLARLEAGHMKPEMQHLHLSPLVTELWAQVCGGAAPGVTWKNNCPPDILVAADSKLLSVVLSNVLANAAAYTPPGNRITAEFHQVAAGGELTIGNTGCGLTEAEAARVFDRFWRADQARSATGLNCGLGLTLVARAMEAMGGQAAARVDSTGRFRLSLTFGGIDRDRTRPEESAASTQAT